MTTFWAVYWLFMPIWVLCAMIGLFPYQHRRFFARMLLATPIWPFVACTAIPTATIRFLHWVWEQSELS